MDIFERDGGTTTADTVHKREEFRQIVTDVQDLPETQRTALLLREIDALSYEQIAEAMDTTVPSVKSLLVRARVSLAEAAEARLLTCDEVRLELGQVAEGIARTSPPCAATSRAASAAAPSRASCARPTRRSPRSTRSGRCSCLKKLLIAKLGFGAARAPARAAGRRRRRGAAPAWRARRGGRRRPGRRHHRRRRVSAGVSTVASKAAAGMAAAVIVTAGAVEVKHVAQPRVTPATQAAVAAPLPARHRSPRPP